MKKVVLSRLWYMFPADDQDLSPADFSQKVRSFVKQLSPREQLTLLEFLVVQYEAFQKQLELLFARSSVSQQEYQARAGRLARYLDTLRGWRQSVDRTREQTSNSFDGTSPYDTPSGSLLLSAVPGEPGPLCAWTQAGRESRHDEERRARDSLDAAE